MVDCGYFTYFPPPTGLRFNRTLPPNLAASLATRLGVIVFVGRPIGVVVLAPVAAVVSIVGKGGGGGIDRGRSESPPCPAASDGGGGPGGGPGSVLLVLSRR